MIVRKSTVQKYRNKLRQLQIEILYEKVNRANCFRFVYGHCASE